MIKSSISWIFLLFISLATASRLLAPQQAEPYAFQTPYQLIFGLSRFNITANMTILKTPGCSPDDYTVNSGLIVAVFTRGGTRQGSLTFLVVGITLVESNLMSLDSLLGCENSFKARLAAQGTWLCSISGHLFLGAPPDQRPQLFVGRFPSLRCSERPNDSSLTLKFYFEIVSKYFACFFEGRRPKLPVFRRCGPYSVESENFFPFGSLSHASI